MACQTQEMLLNLSLFDGRLCILRLDKSSEAWFAFSSKVSDAKYFIFSVSSFDDLLRRGLQFNLHFNDHINFIFIFNSFNIGSAITQLVWICPTICRPYKFIQCKQMAFNFFLDLPCRHSRPDFFNKPLCQLDMLCSHDRCYNYECKKQSICLRKKQETLQRLDCLMLLIYLSRPINWFIFFNDNLSVFIFLEQSI